MSYNDGDIADGPNGAIVFRGGRWVPLSGGPHPITIGTPDPGKEQGQTLDLEHKRLENEQLRRKLAQEQPLSIDPKLDGLTGGAYAAKLPSATQATAQALIDGRMQFPAGAALRSPYWQEMIQHVAHIDPSFDMVNFGARSKARVDFTSGKSAQNIRALNTAIGHLGQLDGQIGGTASHGFTPYNAASNYVVDKFGGSGPGVYEQTAGALASELTQVFRGSGGAEADITRELGHLSSDGSLEQKKAAVRNIAGLLKSRLDALGDQYQQGMGTTAQPLSLLNPHAKQAYTILSGLGAGDGGPGGPKMASGHGGAPGGGNAGGPTAPPPAQPNPGGPPMVLATGATKSVDYSKANAVLDAMIRSGASDSQISAAIKPFDLGPVDPRQTAAARSYLARHPNYQGSFGGVHGDAPTTIWERIKNNPIVQSVATGALGAGDAAMLGTSDEVFGAGKSLFTGRPMGEEIAGLNADKQAAFANNPVSALTGQTLGTIGSMWAGGGGLAAGAAKLGIPKLIAPIAADVAIGAAAGAGQDNDNRLLGAAVGGAGGFAGNLLGQGVGQIVGAAARTAPGLAVTNAARRVGGMAFRGPGIAPITGTAPLSSAERTILNTAGSDLPGITAQLSEARTLGVPLSLADTNPGLRELTGAAVRRSPTAAGIAEQNLLPRNAGQYDRFVSAVDQNIGPTANIPQRSADLTTQARTAAGPLYNRAYAAPVVTTPELEATLNTPFGQQALARARTIAQNERRDPAELGFALDAQGNTVLNAQPGRAMADHLDARQQLDAAQAAYKAARVNPNADATAALNRVQLARQKLRDAEAGLSAAPDPTQAASAPGLTTQTLDYVKRGMDDVLEQQRNPITGKLVLDEAGRAQDTVRKQFLAELDKINPAYADARAAYAGPASERGNMTAGQQAYTANPQQLGVDIAGSSPERLGQMQLGYQGALVDHASRVRDSANPWETTFGSPMARDRFSTMFPDHPGIANILRQRELESGMQQTSNAILGNSRTARNLAADQAFTDSPMLDAGLHAAAALTTHGASLPMTAARYGRQAIGDWWKLGRGASSIAKADELVPTLTNPDPAAAVASVQDMIARQKAYADLLTRTTPTRPLRMFGAGFGSQAPVAALTYGGG